MSDKLSTILFVQGGAGDVLAATPMIRAARKALPDDEIIVAGTYALLLEGNPNIDTLVHLNKHEEVRDFYEEYVVGRKIRYFKKFFVYDHILDTPGMGCTKLTQFITKLYGFEKYYDNNYPDYFKKPYEAKLARRLLGQYNKPIVLLHIFGAVPSENGLTKMLCGACDGKGTTPNGPCQRCGGSGVLIIRDKTNSLKDIDPKLIAPIVAKYKEDFLFVQIGLEGEPIVPGALDFLGMPFRDAAALIDDPQVVSYIFMESSFAHLAASFRKRGVVVFQNTSANYFGYDTAINFQCANGCPICPCDRPVGALMDFAPGYRNPKTRQKELWACPDQKCAKFPVEELEKAFAESLKKPEVELPKIGGQAMSLEDARKL